VTPLWSQAELSAALGALPSNALSTAVNGVSIDSRTLAIGDLFFAIKGDAHDGHDHVARAFEAGASAAVVSRERAQQLTALGPVFAVADTLKAMERLGLAARARSMAKIVAVTGSVGKTTAKEMLRTMLAACGPTHASAASYNNHWGVPLTLARMPTNARFGVFEMGMNHAGEITPLTRMARPHVALVTTIAPVHIEHLGSIEAIADAKAEIFLGLEPHGTAILNRDAPQFERLTKAAEACGARVRNFGRNADCRAQLLEIGAPGLHMAQDALGALLTAETLGADVRACAAALASFSPQKGRGDRFVLSMADGPATIIDESYNANPASMRAALALLAAAKPGPKGRRIAVIGDMLELGPKAAEMHAELAGDLSANKVDLLFGAGPLTRALYEAAPESMRAAWTEGSSELTDEVARTLRGGDIAMIKGSNGSRMGPLVSALRDRFAPHSAGG
jgi:UDP-N-acetylmuramoyl-tripeptide--D-alanyl-D-alanine ligase